MRYFLVALAVAVVGCDGVTIGGSGGSRMPSPPPPTNAVTCLQAGGFTDSFTLNAPCFVGRGNCLFNLTAETGSGTLLPNHLGLSPKQVLVQEGQTANMNISMVSGPYPQNGIQTVYVKSQNRNCGFNNPDLCPKTLVQIVNLMSNPCL